jgi:hypothetical protein
MPVMTSTGVRDPEDPQDPDRWLVGPWPADASFRAVLQHFHQVSSTQFPAGTSAARLLAFREGFCWALAAAPTGKFADQTDEDRRSYILSCADLAVRIVRDLDVAEYGRDPQAGEDQHVRAVGHRNNPQSPPGP